MTTLHPALSAQTQEASPEVEKVAGRIVRTKSFLSKQLKTNVPVFAAGAVTTLVIAARRSRKQNAEMDVDTNDDSSE